MWKEPQKIGLMQIHTYEALGKKRISFRTSNYNSPTFKIRLYNYIDDKEVVIEVDVLSQNVDDVKEEAVKLYKELESKEIKIISDIEVLKQRYHREFYNFAKSKGADINQ